MYQSIDISSRLMSMNARTRVPAYSQQGMLHISSTINACSPWLNTKNTTLDTKKGRVLLNLLIMNAPTFVCPGLSSCTLMSDQGALSCQSCPQGRMAMYSIFPWDYHNRVSLVVFPPTAVSSCLFCSPLHMWRWQSWLRWLGHQPSRLWSSGELQ